ncbi:MAG: CDP-alcohol phosphatidyltransferase family protein [Acidimicrobiales bacterium]
MEAVRSEAVKGQDGLDRVWTLPNVISFTRIALLGVFCWLLFGPGERIAATLVLMFVGVTDFLDGYLARKFHQVSTLGKVLDPVADRAVLLTSVLAIEIYGAIPAWLAGVVLGRELLVSAAVLALAAMRARRIDVLWVGKAGTFGLLCCLPLFLLGDEHVTWARVLTDATWVALVPALVLSFVAAAAYVPHARRALSARRSQPIEHEAAGR